MLSRLFRRKKVEKKTSSFEEMKRQLMEDWGRDDVYGPWSKNEEVDLSRPLKFYKSYWLITDNRECNIDLK